MRSSPLASSMRRWWTPISPAGRSTISSASRSPRCCGASCRAPARPAACSRWRCGSSATARPRSRPSSPRSTGPSRRCWPRAKGEEFAARLNAIAGKRLDKLDIKDAASRQRHQGRHRGRRLHGRLRREEGGAAQPLRALHHLDAAAGGLAQARLLRQADDERGPAPLRGRRPRRRDGRPHHLHAHRRRHHHPRGHRRHPQARRAGLLQALPAALHPRVQGQGQERAGSARGDPPDRPAAQARGGCAPPAARPGAPLRADLEARGGKPDGLRRARADDGRDRGARQGRQGLRAEGDRLGRAVRRLPQALRGRPRRPRQERQGRGGGRRRQPPPAAAGPGRRPEGPGHRGQAALHRAAAALHRGDAGQAHGGAGHRPALHLRLHAGRAARTASTCASTRSG